MDYIHVNHNNWRRINIKFFLRIVEFKKRLINCQKFYYATDIIIVLIVVLYLIINTDRKLSMGIQNRQDHHNHLSWWKNFLNFIIIFILSPSISFWIAIKTNNNIIIIFFLLSLWRNHLFPRPLIFCCTSIILQSAQVDF